MATLNSPGVSVTIIDESQYAPTQAGSTAYILLATAQDKKTPSNTVATGTTIPNAEKIISVTSQRDLVNMFGTPKFQLDNSGNPINGSELNEYGLLAAYSALGVSNQMYVQRANVDLNELTGTSVRPTGSPPNGTYWFDLTDTNFGIYEWDGIADGFTLETPLIITSSSYLSGGVPLSSYGSIGQYAVVTTSTSNPIYYKGYNNQWVLVGSQSWEAVVPALVGSNTASTISLTVGSKMIVNGTTVTMTGTTITSAATAINGASIQGVTANVNVNGQLTIFATNVAISSGNIYATPDGLLKITNGATLGNATVDAATQLGLYQTGANVTNNGNTYTYLGPTIQFSGYTNVPAWRPTDVTPRPIGSVWFKTSATGNGANWYIQEYSSTLGAFQLLGSPLYDNDFDAINGLSPVAGGADLPVGTVYVQYNTLNAYLTAAGLAQATFKPYVKSVAGVLTITGTAAGGTASYTAGNTFKMTVSVPGQSSTASAVVYLSGNTAASLASSINSVSPSLNNQVVAGINSSGAVYVTHTAGGAILFQELTGTPLATAGLLSDAKVQTITSGSLYLASPFTPLTYTYSLTSPYSNPTDGTLWYYSNPLDVDIMINTGSAWVGYQNVTSDARGYNLANTDPNGVILSASQPITQSDGTALVSGDLWINTGDLENFPVLYRYNATTGSWALIDNTDQVSSNGIVFADARWSYNGNTNPITDNLPSIQTLLTSNYLDPDAPSSALYARGTLLFNTRRSGYNVKKFESTYFATEPANYTGNSYTPPAQVGSWITHSGDDPTTGVPYFGHKAQRSVIVTALKSAISSSTALREDQYQFNLIVCPGYPELIESMITLNDDRQNTAFIIGDSPLDLSSDSTTLTNWLTNANMAADNGDVGLVSHSEYLGVYYPSGLATNLDGNNVVVPPSHMMLRTIIRSDNVSYPWFAPAGVRRGLIDNASSIGYIDINDNNVWRSIGVTNGLRDILYENEVNPITVLPGVGIVAYGQKTCINEQSAMNRINVARLVCYLRLVLAQTASPFIFEPNDTITRSQVQSAFNAIFNDLVAKRGIYDYLVVCDTTNNTPDRIDNNELWVDIAIQPVKAVEFIYIPVRLENTGSPLTIA